MANAPSGDYTGFDLPGVPWVSYFTSDGIALHGAYWHIDFGVPHSHGCVNMTPEAANGFNTAGRRLLFHLTLVDLQIKQARGLLFNSLISDPLFTKQS